MPFVYSMISSSYVFPATNIVLTNLRRWGNFGRYRGIFKKFTGGNKATKAKYRIISHRI